MPKCLDTLHTATTTHGMDDLVHQLDGLEMAPTPGCRYFIQSNLVNLKSLHSQIVL